MTALQAEANAADAPGTRLADLSPCPSCGELLIGPKTSSYLGLGRIEHNWHCDACGARFKSTTRLAGLVEVEELEHATANG
jgi:hypothetical protein